MEQPLLEQPLLAFVSITKQFAGIQALENVHVHLKHGHLLGLIGENGAGKSTLMNILGGNIKADSGQMLLDGQNYLPQSPADASDKGIAFIHQELNLFTNLTITDNLFINSFPRYRFWPFINKNKAIQRCAQLLQMVGLHVSPSTPVAALSSGEQQLVEIAKAFAVGARIFIFDEPTTSLTSKEIAKLFELITELKSQGKAIIYITHILADVVQLADEIAILRDGKVVIQDKISVFTISSMISAMVGRDLQQYYPIRTKKIQPETVLEIKGLEREGIIKDISCCLHKGEILGVFGLMGSGRSELARIIFGMDSFTKGSIIIDGKHIRSCSPKGNIENGLALVTENRREDGLLMDESLLNNIALPSLKKYAKGFLLNEKRMLNTVGECVNRMHIKCNDLDRIPVQNMSGGNQQKTVIAKWLLSKPKVFILDEPTQGIDVAAKFEIFSIINELAAEGSGILYISSELEELIHICDRILVMRLGEIVGTEECTHFNQERILKMAYGETAS
jgi:ribose transport system ATP-binding protein